MLYTIAVASGAIQTGPEAFCGMMGVTCALVLASRDFVFIYLILKISDLLMVRLNPEWEYALSVYLNQTSSWNQLFQLSWLVSWVFTGLLSGLYSYRKVKRPIVSLFTSPYNGLHILQWICTFGKWFMLWPFIFGSWVGDRDMWRRGRPVQRTRG